MAVQAKYLFDQDFAPDAKSAEKVMAPAELAMDAVPPATVTVPQVISAKILYGTPAAS